MTKKEAVLQLKEEFRNAATANKLKAVRDVYAEVKNLNITDTDNIPDKLLEKIQNV